MKECLSDYISEARIPFVLDHQAKIAISQASPPDLRGEISLCFPSLSEALKRAQYFALKIEKRDFMLLAWRNTRGKSMGWLCDHPEETKAGVSHCHSLLISMLGGIRDYWGDYFHHELVNKRFFGTLERSGAVELVAALTEGGDSPLPPISGIEEAIVVSEEYNGNRAFYCPGAEDLYFWAPDHCDESLIEVPHLRRWYIHTKARTATFSHYVELLANQWLSHIEK